MPATVQLGSHGDDVKRLQRVLRRSMRLAPFGPISATFGADTDAAVRQFQTDEGLVVDGIVGPVTWSYLPPYREASPTVRAGSTGPVVAWLQQVLAGDVVAVLFPPYTGAIDGIAGAQTETAIRALQKFTGVTIDGIVGDQTWFSWLTPGSAQQLTVEAAAGLLDRLPAF